jgi:hypothetical protein
MVRLVIQIFIIFGLSALLPAFSIAQSTLIPMRPSVVVEGSSISLLDLLDSAAPQDLRSKAANINVGTAPSFGSTRRITRPVLLDLLAGNHFPADHFLIPSAISVQRAARPITSEKVFDAIQKALLKNGLTDFLSLNLEDISLDARILVPRQEIHLEVTQITFDDLLGCARFRIWIPSSPSISPFYATARLSNSVSSRAFRVVRSPSILPVSIPRAMPAVSPVLVRAGFFARLHLHSANSSLLLRVTPLQNGHLDDLIRVRLPANGHVLQARVLSIGVLDANF